jgi:hypothetical protein
MWFSSENVHSEVWSNWSRGNLRSGTQNHLQAGIGVSTPCEAEISQSKLARRLEIIQISVEDWLCAQVNWWPLPRASRDTRLMSKTSRADQHRTGLIPCSSNDIEPNSKSDSSYTLEEAFQAPSSTFEAPLIDVDESLRDESRLSLQAISAMYTFDVMQPGWLRRTQSFRPRMRIFVRLVFEFDTRAIYADSTAGAKKNAWGADTEDVQDVRDILSEVVIRSSKSRGRSCLAVHCWPFIHRGKTRAQKNQEIVLEIQYSTPWKVYRECCSCRGEIIYSLPPSVKKHCSAFSRRLSP